MKDYIVLPDRLKAVAALIPECDFLTDVGTDHAYIPIYAVKNGIAKRAAAADVVDGPLKIAAANIKNYNLSDKISVVKSDGLTDTPSSDVIVIAGMGGTLISDILTAGQKKAHAAKALILQPMTCACDLRKSLHRLGFKIVKETIAKDSGKLYNVMVAQNGMQNFADEFYYHIGEYPLKNSDPLLFGFISQKLTVLKRKIDGMAKSESSAVKQELESCMALYEKYKRTGEQIDKGM